MLATENNFGVILRLTPAPLSSGVAFPNKFYTPSLEFVHIARSRRPSNYGLLAYLMYAIVCAKNDNDTISANEQRLDQKVTFTVSEVWQWPPWGRGAGCCHLATLDGGSARCDLAGLRQKVTLGPSPGRQSNMCRAHVQNGKARERAAGRALMG